MLATLPEETTAPPSPYAQKPISFSTPAGWNYVLTTDLVMPIITFSKDVQTSPPGKAKLTSTSSSSPLSSATVQGATAGRTPPPLAARVHLLIPLPGVRDAAGAYTLPGRPKGEYQNVDSAGACEETVAYWGYLAEAFKLKTDALYGFVCEPNASGATKEDLPEPFVDALLPVLQSRASQLVVFVGVGGGTQHYDCGVLYYPDGRRVIGQALKTGTCGD